MSLWRKSSADGTQVRLRGGSPAVEAYLFGLLSSPTLEHAVGVVIEQGECVVLASYEWRGNDFILKCVSLCLGGKAIVMWRLPQDARQAVKATALSRDEVADIEEAARVYAMPWRRAVTHDRLQPALV